MSSADNYVTIVIFAVAVCSKYVNIYDLGLYLMCLVIAGQLRIVLCRL